MKLALIQSDLFWEEPHKNLQHFDQLCNEAAVHSDLIVLPEMFSTGFTMKPETLAEVPGGAAFQWMKEFSTVHSKAVAGSVAVKDQERNYNRFYFFEPGGKDHHYDKRHLFRMGHEDEHYSPGNNRTIVNFKGWKICTLVCYDLRFPVWSRNQLSYVEERVNGETKLHYEYDLLVYVANWPAVRISHWKHLLIARAIENQCYVAGVNRIGIDGNGNAHCGGTVIVSPKGEIVAAAEDDKQTILTAELSMDELVKYRNAFPAGLDADRFTISGDQNRSLG